MSDHNPLFLNGAGTGIVNVYQLFDIKRFTGMVFSLLPPKLPPCMSGLRVVLVGLLPCQSESPRSSIDRSGVGLTMLSPLTRKKNVASGCATKRWFRSTRSSTQSSAGDGNPAETLQLIKGKRYAAGDCAAENGPDKNCDIRATPKMQEVAIVERAFYIRQHRTSAHLKKEPPMTTLVRKHFNTPDSCVLLVCLAAVPFLFLA